MISDTFSHFGVITFVFYQTGSSFGFVNFQSSEDAKNVFNKVGAHPDLDQVEEPSFLLGDVHHHQGVIREVNVNCVQKVVVSFRDSLVVIMLGGTKQRILYAEHEVMEVSREAIGKKSWEFVG